MIPNSLLVLWDTLTKKFAPQNCALISFRHDFEFHRKLSIFCEFLEFLNNVASPCTSTQLERLSLCCRSPSHLPSSSSSSSGRIRIWPSGLVVKRTNVCHTTLNSLSSSILYSLSTPHSCATSLPKAKVAAIINVAGDSNVTKADKFSLRAFQKSLNVLICDKLFMIRVLNLSLRQDVT